MERRASGTRRGIRCTQAGTLVSAPDTAAELIAFCREHLAHLKCPRSVDFTDELPRSPTGKLYKKALRDSYWGQSRSRIV